MSAATAIIITVLVVAVIGLVVALAVTVSQQSSETTSVQSTTTVNTSDNTETVNTSTGEVTQGSNQRESCMIKVTNEDDTKETIAIGEPWYLDQNNKQRCFAPVGQKCCEQVDLPGGEEGCMIDFTGYTPARIAQWKTDCLATGGAIDMDKLAILNTHFSGDWMVDTQDGQESQDDIKFTFEVSGVNFKVKKDDKMFGLYTVSHITVNPNKHLQANYTSDSGTKTDVIIEDDTEGNTVLRIIETPANTDNGQLTTYKLSKIQT